MATTLASPISAAVEQQPSRFTTRLLLIYIFMLYSRIFEAAISWGVPNLYLMMLLSALALALVLFKGTFVQAARQPIGMLLLAFTVWAILVLPFSDWKSESLHQLTGVWLKSAAAFFIIVGLTKDFSDSRKAFAAFGWSAAVSAVVMTATFRLIGDRMTSVGSLGNSNEAAFHLIFGLPFLIWLIMRVKFIWKVPLAVTALVSLALAVKTASRAGVLMVGILTLVALLKVPPRQKVKILAVAAVAGIVGLMSLDRVALERYKTLFDDSQDNSAEAISARESAENRKYLLREGIELTFQHPIFGVGMGVFPVAAAELSKSRGEHPLWLVSHNSFVQVSSETGFGGFFLMIGMFLTSFALILKLDRTAKRLGLAEIRGMSVCLLLSFIALSIDYFFDAAAYDVYMPMAAGLLTALTITAKPLIQEAAARGGLPATDTQFSAVLAPGLLSTDSRFPSIATTASAATTDVTQPRNPYRLGRRRVAARRAPKPVAVTNNSNQNNG